MDRPPDDNADTAHPTFVQHTTTQTLSGSPKTQADKSKRSQLTHKSSGRRRLTNLQAPLQQTKPSEKNDGDGLNMSGDGNSNHNSPTGCFSILKHLTCSLQCGGTKVSIKDMSNPPIDSVSPTSSSSSSLDIISQTSLQDCRPPVPAKIKPTRKRQLKRKIEASSGGSNDVNLHLPTATTTTLPSNASTPSARPSKRRAKTFPTQELN